MPLPAAEAIVERKCNHLDDTLTLIWNNLEWGKAGAAFYGKTSDLW